jgi:hypothetical protein
MALFCDLTCGVYGIIIWSYLWCVWKYSLTLLVVECIWNLMAHSDAWEGKWRGKWRMEWVASTLTLPQNVVYSALLALMCTPWLLAVDWTDAHANLNGLARFGERQNLVSVHVPSSFKCSLSVALPVVVCMALFCGITCGMWHIIVLVLCLDCLFQLISDAPFYFVLVVFVYIYWSDLTYIT